MNWGMTAYDGTGTLKKAAEILEKCEPAIQTLIALNLLALAIETIPSLSSFWQQALTLFELVTVVIFTLEYMTRWALSRPFYAYGVSASGLVDLAAILPFYIAAGFDLRAIRALRFVRLFRILKLTKYNDALRKYRCAFKDTQEEFAICGFTAFIVIYLSSMLIWYFENPVQPEEFSSVFTSMWWTLCTITTVGYGDVYPVTTGGRILTSFVLVAGIGIVSVSSGLLAAALTKSREDGKGDEVS